MVQHLILIMVAAPLFAVASPLDLAWRSTSGTAHLVVTEALRSRVATILGNPFVAFVLYALVIPVSHLTTWYNLTLEHESVHNAEHLAFLLVGYLFWRQIFGSDPNKHRLHPALQFFYLFMAIPIDTFTGLSLAGASHELFPAYFATHRTWGPSYVTDLHVGGDISGRRRHAHVVADDSRCAPLDAHGRAQSGSDRPGARRAGAARGCRRRPRARSSAEIHQLDADPVRIGAVDELEGRSSEVDAGPARLDDRTAELHNAGGRAQRRRAPGRKGASARADSRPDARVVRMVPVAGKPTTQWRSSRAG